MPRGPNGEKRPADVIARAVIVARIATGEIEELLPKVTGRTRSGQAGAAARNKSLGGDRRSEIAKKAASARWAK
jgi:hypothetical protein